MAKEILITGGYGYLGAWISEYLIKRGYSITILSRKKYSFLDHLNHRFIPCDIAVSNDCVNKLSNLHFDFIIHTASMNDYFIDNYQDLSYNVNAIGTRNILESISYKKLKRFIYLSTFHVYGDKHLNIDEQSELNPVNDYALSHVFAEFFIKKYFNRSEASYTILRLTNCYGCPKNFYNSKWYLVLNDIVYQATVNKSIVLKSNGNALRDYVWIGDLCATTEYFINDSLKINYILNLSRGKALKVIELAKIVCEVFNKLYKINVDVNINSNDNNEYANHLHVSSKKLKDLTKIVMNDCYEQEIIKMYDLINKNNTNT